MNTMVRGERRALTGWEQLLRGGRGGARARLDRLCRLVPRQGLHPGVGVSVRGQLGGQGLAARRAVAARLLGPASLGRRGGSADRLRAPPDAGRDGGHRLVGQRGGHRSHLDRAPGLGLRVPHGLDRGGHRRGPALRGPALDGGALALRPALPDPGGVPGPDGVRGGARPARGSRHRPRRGGRARGPLPRELPRPGQVEDRPRPLGAQLLAARHGAAAVPRHVGRPAPALGAAPLPRRGAGRAGVGGAADPAQRRDPCRSAVLLHGLLRRRARGREGRVQALLAPDRDTRTP